MSLILEALRKSEAERRRAQIPDLLAEPQATPTPTAVRSIPRWPFAAAVLVALLVVAVAIRALWPVTTPLPVASTPAPPPTHVQADRSTPIRASLPPRTQPVVVAPATAPPLPTPVAPTKQAVAAPVASEAPPPSAPTESSSTLATPPVVDTALRVSDLAIDERQQLPPLKMSMHMWNADRAQRFVILDGIRLNEGDRIGDAVVSEIQADGVLLSWHGRMLVLPLR
jgi:general secretion pathway protein B